MLDHLRRVRHIGELRLLIPRPALRRSVRRQVVVHLHRLVRLDVPKQRLGQLAQRLQRFHEHLRVRHFAGQQIVQHLLRTRIDRPLQEHLICLACSGFGRDVRAQVAHHIAALVDVGRRPAHAGIVDQVRATAANREDRAVLQLRHRLLDPARVLFDQLAHHLEVAELLHRDVLQQIANPRLRAVERLDPILQARRQLARRAAKLLQQKLRKHRVRLAHFNWNHQLFPMEKHRQSPFPQGPRTRNRTWSCRVRTGRGPG